MVIGYLYPKTLFDIMSNKIIICIIMLNSNKCLFKIIMKKKQQKNSEKFAQAKQSSKMMDELSQLKIFGGKSMEAQKLSLGNCKTICSVIER